MEEKDEITLKDLILKAKEFWSEIWDKKWSVVGIGILFGVLFGMIAFLTKPTYNAKLTFMVNDDEGGGGMAGVSALLGQFGLGGGGGGKYNYNKIIQIGHSNRILEQVVLEKHIIDGKSDFLGNHLINIYQFHDKWKKDTLLNQFYFKEKHQNQVAFRIALKSVIVLLSGNPQDPKSPKLCSLAYDEESTIMEMQCSSLNEDLSIAIANSWYSKLSNFYIQKSIERQLKTYETLNAKADSIYGLLSGSESTLARSSDVLGLVKTTDYLPKSRSVRNIQMYSTMYAEIVKNKETAEFILKSETPFFQIIDQPFKPIDKEKTSTLIQLIIGGIIGGILTIIFIIISSILKNTLSE